MSKKYLLSVLVPAYNYPDGIERILSRLPFSERQDFECVIFDNSSNEQVAKLAQSKCEVYENFRFQHFIPSTTAVDNWNGLLNSANAEYVMLLHHDEFFASSAGFIELLHHLRNESPDMVLLNLRKYHIKQGWSHLHLPYFLRALLLKSAPRYLLHHNFIGPTATIVVSRSLVNPFDSKLKWLIDVGWFLGLLNTARRISFLPNVSIMTGVDDHLTLTKSLDGQISQLIQSETAYLKAEHEANGGESNTNFKSFYFRFIDRPAWCLLRVVMMPWVLCSLRRYKDPLRI